ncbi:MAG: hypothetical protein HY074_07770 [Deltaproteobacteria bacterium]|nr:hypothetical protein [Deltaproteobacteria bacterium]
MQRLISTPSVGGVIKKIMAINPDLTAQDMIEIIKMSVERKNTGASDGFSKLEVVNEALALDLARETLKQ